MVSTIVCTEPDTASRISTEDTSVYIRFIPFSLNPNFTSNSQTHYMGSTFGRSYGISYAVSVGTDIYFLWQWSNDTVELWKYDIVTGIFTMVKDCGDSTALPPLEQCGIAYDGGSNLYFVLENTTESMFYIHIYNMPTFIPCQHL